MKAIMRTTILVVMGLLLPTLSHARDLAGKISSLHEVLEDLYNEMIPLCSNLIGVAQGIAGFAATWYVATRVWQHIARAEPIDFYPLFRPFALGFCIMIFPSVLGLMNGILKPTVTATAAMVDNSDQAIASLLERRVLAMSKSDAWQMYIGDDLQGDKDKWYRYTHDNADPDDQNFFASLGNDIKFHLAKSSYILRSTIKQCLYEILRVLFEAAALCIDTLRTFQLVVLAILGPLVFGLAVFDGFQHSLSNWMARYINIFLWLPIANIFGCIIGKIQERMLERDIVEIASQGDTVFNSYDAAYMVFMIIGIVGYFTVPSTASFIVNAGMPGALQQKISNIFSSTTGTVVNTATGGATSMLDAGGNIMKGGYQHGDGRDNQSGYQKDKLKGNS